MTQECKYIKVFENGYHADWASACGERIRMVGPMEVGMPLNPLPNEEGKYCRFCGNLIAIDAKGFRNDTRK